MTNLVIGKYSFRKFNIAARNIFEKHIKKVNKDISDYSFTLNYIWLARSNGYYAIINKCFCLFMMLDDELTMVLPPIGKKQNSLIAIKDCFEIMNVYNLDRNYSKIDCVQEDLIRDYIDGFSETTEFYDMDNSFVIEKVFVDYVYEIDKLIELKGNNYHTKRTEINKFNNLYPNHLIEKLDPVTHSDGISSLMQMWISSRIKYITDENMSSFLDGVQLEKSAIKKMLKNYEILDLKGLVVKIDDKIVGFTIGEKLNDITASVLIEKTDFNIDGCAQYIFREFSKILKDEYLVQYINAGDDMGFENLKKVKLSYRPYQLIPKYKIFQKMD